MVLCVTGPMAAGKNAAADFFAAQGFLSIDADQTAHTAIENRKDDIIAAFGPLAHEKRVAITNEDGSINRRALGSILFSDPALLAKQESIVHPEVDRILNRFIDDHPGQNIVLNATVLYKTPVCNRCDAIIFVDAPIIVRLKRAKKRDGHSVFHLLRRFYAQREIFAKYKNLKTDIYRVWNSGTRAQLEKKLRRLLDTLNKG